MIKNYLERIETEDINPLIRKVMDPFFARLRTKPGIEGIVELGGLAQRNFSDIHSDVDASLFVSELQPWLPMFEFYVPTPNSLKPRFFEINVHQNTLEREHSRNEWEEGKKEAYEEGRIIFDPNCNIASLVEARVNFDEVFVQNRKSQMYHAISSFNSSGNPLKDHLALNKMANQTVELMYFVNEEFRPHKKWRLEKARYLPNLPNNYENLIENIYLIKEISTEDVKRRLAAVRELAHHYKPSTLLSIPSLPIHQEYSLHNQMMMTSLILGQLYWLVDVNPMRQVSRGFALNSHDLLNEGISLALETRRIISGEMIKQYVEALDVIYPSPEYDESEYDLLTVFDQPHSGELLARAILTPNFSSETVQKRVVALQSITKPLHTQLIELGLVSEDPYHFAIVNCYFDRQLLEKTFAETTCPSRLSEDDE
ncbi:MAG: hypothetical protein KJ597_01660, partial [Nanoarchaeota archaeon]|nr:hypothetical protein [Nanoarchaeota archaeon]